MIYHFYISYHRIKRLKHIYKLLKSYYSDYFRVFRVKRMLLFRIKLKLKNINFKFFYKINTIIYFFLKI